MVVRQSILKLAMYWRLVLNSDPPASISQVLGLKTQAIMSSSSSIFVQAQEKPEPNHVSRTLLGF